MARAVADPATDAIHHADAGGRALDAVVAVDGGGSKTDIVVIGLDGELLAHARGPGSSPQVLGLPAATAVLNELRDRALAGAPAHRIIDTHVYLSGLDLPDELRAARAALASWNASVVDNDLFALLRAGTREANAAAVVCGTGINAIAVRGDGATSRFPAIGGISGDWGGGSFLGAKALWFAARAEDGRGPATMLQQMVPALLGLASVREVTEALHFGRLGASTFARLCPTLFAAAAAGDVVSASVVDRQALEIVLLATTALTRLGLEGDVVPVVLGGGVLAARDPRLMAGIESGLAERMPRAWTSVVTVPPLLGAGLHALESVGADNAALRRFETNVLAQEWARAGVPA